MTNIDKNSRLNTAEHIFFRILLNEYQAKPKGLNNNGDSISLRVESPLELNKIALTEYESKAQNIINQNIEVKKYELDREKIIDVDVSLVPANIKKLRIVDIVGFDKQACRDPHVDNTSEIGKFQILKIKSKGGNTYNFNITVL